MLFLKRQLSQGLFAGWNSIKMPPAPPKSALDGSIALDMEVFDRSKTPFGLDFT
jgi:hypothetical protein